MAAHRPSFRSKVASLSSFDGLPNLSKKEPDLGSPDVMLDHTGQLFVLYLHTAFGCSSSRPDKGGTAQVSAIASKGTQE